MTEREDTEQISQGIRDVVGANEDAFQDAWVKILEAGVTDLDKVMEIAAEVKRKATHEVLATKCTTRSLDKPLTAEGDFTLKDIIESKPDEFPTASTRPRGGIQGRRSIEVDQDVVDAIRARYGNMALVQAVRVMLDLPQKMAENAWQEEEDQLIREHYPTMGGPPLAKVLDRGVDCIRERASDLGVRRQWAYKRDRRAYNVVRRERTARAREKMTEQVS